MKVLILGASGFLGSECSKVFSLNGYKVITSDINGEVDYMGSLSDPNFVNKLPSADVIVNCAAVQYVSRTLPFFLRRGYFLQNNVISAKYLAERFKKEKSHFIHIGTSMMYAQNFSQEYTVESEMRGSGIYSLSKISAQKFINSLPRVATVIPCIIGGIGREGLFRNFVNTIDRWNLAIFPGAGNNKISIVHVSDVASLIYKIAQTSSTGYFNAAAKDSLSINEWVDEISRCLGKNKTIKISINLSLIEILAYISRYRLLAKEQLLMLKMPHILSIQKSLSIGWTPQKNSAQIIDEITNYIKNTSI
jgi:nucleoside-diphosphate-sugar epimerase